VVASRLLKLPLALAVLAISLLTASRADAGEAPVYLPIGVIGSVSNRGVAIGFEATVDVPYVSDVVGLGLLGQYQWVSGGGRRLVGGAQVMFFDDIVGLEAGIVRFEHSATADTGVHLAPFASIGWFYAALRVDIPVYDRAGAPPVEVGLVLAFKVPLPLGGDMRHIGLGG
jgi:hypothetical protein